MFLKLYKYRSCCNDREFGYLKDIILEGKVWASCPQNFNDPYECLPSFQKCRNRSQNDAYLEEACARNRRQLNRRLKRCAGSKIAHYRLTQKDREEFEERWRQSLRKLGVVCFSGDPNNILMWSHYANNHRGLALEVLLDEDDARLFEVEYTSDRIVCPLFRKEEGRLHEIRDVLKRKFHDWRYEREYRLLHDIQEMRNRGNGELAQIPKQSIKKILLGAKASPALEDSLRKMLSDNELNIPIIKVKLDPLKYRVNV